MDSLTAQDIANFLDTPLEGENISITSIESLNSEKDYTLGFIRKKEVKEPLSTKRLFLVPLDKKIDKKSTNTYIRLDNPRLGLAKITSKYFRTYSPDFSHLSHIHPTATIGENVTIGAYCVIGKNVTIKDNTSIQNHVTIGDGVTIGCHCQIKSSAIIGESGFAYENDTDTPIKIHHQGSVTVKDHVDIGNHTVIDNGTVEDTIIGNHVKMDNHVHISHNCSIGDNTIIINHASISGSVTIGKNCWIGPNSTIIQKKTIGDNALIGIGATVTRNIKPGEKLMGLEAKNLVDLAKIKMTLGY